MSVSDQFRTFAEMDTAADFIQFLEALESGGAGAGTNRPLARLARGLDALLDVVQSLKVSQMAIGGGTFTWNGSTLSWSSNISINGLNEVADTLTAPVIPAGNVNISSNSGIAYCKVDRVSGGSVTGPIPASNMPWFMANVLTGDADRLDYFIMALRNGNDVILWDGRRIRLNESLTNNGYTDSQYGPQAELTLVRANQRENLNAQLTGGGTLTWSQPTDTFGWSQELVVEFPSSAGNNAIAAGSAVIAAGQVAYVSLSREPGSSVGVSLTVLNDGSVPDDDDAYVVALHNPTDGRLYLADGTALSDGDSILLGGVANGVQFQYYQPGDGSQTTDLTNGAPAASYTVGTGELMVYRNGVKAKRSLSYWNGTFPTGALLNGGAFDSDDEYVEEDSGDGTGSRVLWLRDNSGDALGHATGTHTPAFSWPSATDHLEAFVGVHGQGPSPVESVAKLGDATLLEGAVKLEEGANVTITPNAGSNSLVIAASVIAGVADLNGVTAAVELVGGTGVAVTPAGQQITIDGVENLSDLSDVSVDEAAAFQGMQAPSSANVITTRSDLMSLVGFDHLWVDVLGNIRTAGGILRLGSAVYPHSVTSDPSDEVICSTSDLIGAESLQLNDWSAIYVGPGVSPGDPPVMKISRYFPDPTTEWGRHPTQSSYFYVGCVYVTGGADFIQFSKSNGWTYLGSSFDVTGLFSSYPQPGTFLVDLLGSSGLRLKDKAPPGQVGMTLQISSSFASSAGAVHWIQTGMTDVLGRRHRAVMGTGLDPGIDAGIGEAVSFFDIRIPVDPQLGALFRILDSLSWDSVDVAEIYAFSDGRYSVATARGDDYA